MSLFDRLRPKWKHSDPAVRVAAVRLLEDHTVLAALAEHDPDDQVRVAAIHALTHHAMLAQLALSAESESGREAAAESMADRALLQRLASSDPSAIVRAHARARCADANSAGHYLREILAKLPVAERPAEPRAEFCGTLDEVCHALSQDPRFFINGDVDPDGEDASTAQLRDTTHVGWATAARHSNRVVARFVAQPRQPTDAARAAAGLTRFFHVKVWRIAENRFDLVAEEKRFSSTHDALAWSRASSGSRDTHPAVNVESRAGQM